MSEQMKTNELYLHGTSMLYFTPVNKEQVTWNTQNAWKSVLELANDSVELVCTDNEQDYLVVDLSYTVTCKVAALKGKYYSINGVNKDLPELKEAYTQIDVQTAGLETVKEPFEKYIQKVKKSFKNIILVRMACPDCAFNKYFVQRYKPEGVEAYTKTLQEMEEYFIEQVSPVVVDFGRFYFHDYKNRKFGIYTSYEESYYQNMAEVFCEVIVKKNTQKLYEIPNYKYILQRYLTYYEKAKERVEQHLILDRNTPLNQVIRSMNQNMIKENMGELCKLATKNPKTFDEILALVKPELGQFISLVKVVMEGQVTLKQIPDIFGHEYDLELEILTITRAYYAEKEYMQKHFVNRINLKAFYSAMVAAEQGDIAYAVQEVNEALKLVDEEIKPYNQSAETIEDFAQSIGYYVSQSQLIPVDVWGKFITNMIVQKPVGYYKACMQVNNRSFTREEDCAEIYKKMQRSEAQWLIFDMYCILDNDPDIFEKSDEEIQAALDTFISFVTKRYGNHSYLHKLTIQTSYVDAEGNQVDFANKDELAKRAEFLNKWQNYVAGNLYGHVINVGYKHKLTLDSFIVNDGINYGMDYFDEARTLLRRIVHYNVKPLMVENYVNAYMNLNLGDDLFLETLANRYPKTEFTIFSKNKYVKRPLEKYTNLKFITEEFPSSIESCKRNITIGGSMFIEGAFWQSKYQRNLDMVNKSKRSFILGANFGPYNEPEFVEKHKELFEKCDLVCFRDSDSYNEFADVKSVQESVDILFGSKYTSKQKGEGAVISVINLKTRPRLAEYWETYIESMANLCQEMVAVKMPVCLMSFCDNEGDYVAINDIMEKLDDSVKAQVRTYSYDGDTQEAMNVIDSARYVVGTRFHAVVLGFLLEKCVCPIAYSNKTSNLLADLQFPKEYCTVEDTSKLSLDFVKEHEAVQVPLKKLRKKAKRHFKKLDRIFKIYKYFV